MKKFLAVLLAGILTSGLLCFTAVAETPLKVGEVALTDVEGSDTLATLSFKCDTTEDIQYMTVLLTTVEVTADTAGIAFDEIVHIDQVERKADGVYSFTVNRARIPEKATSLYLKVGGTSVDEPFDDVIALKSFLKGDCNGDGSVDALDLALIRQYFAGLEVEIDLNAANVDDSDGLGVVDAMDVAKFRQRIAGLIDSFD